MRSPPRMNEPPTRDNPLPSWMSLASKSVSLNEVERRRELTEEKTRKAAHEADLRTLGITKPVTLDVGALNAKNKKVA